MRSEVRSDTKLFREISQVLLKQGISVRFRAMGRSMFPAIRDGEVVQVEPAANASTGDVVLVDSTDGLVAHRVISSSGATAITRGDSCCETDGGRNPVLGRISKVIDERGGRSPRNLRTYIRAILARFQP